MAKKKKKGMTAVEKLKRNLMTGALILLVIYIGIHIITRTGGFNRLVTDKLSNGTRLPVTLEKCGATPLLGLRLQGLDFYGVRMPDVRIKIDWFARLSKEKPLVKRLDINGLEVAFRQVPATGNWQPLVMNDLGSRFGAVVGIKPAIGAAYDELPRFPAFVINKKTLLDLHRARITWYDGQNRELAYVTDVDSQVKVVAFSDRKALQVQLDCSHVKLASGPLLRDFELEAVQIDGYEHTLIMKMGCSEGEFEGFQTKTLWEDLFHHLSQLAEI